MISLVRSWVLGVTAAAILVSIAQGLMPPGPVSKVGKFTCGLLLMAAVLRPFGAFDPGAGQLWLREWQTQLELQRLQLDQDRYSFLEQVIAERTAAYILDRAAQLGATCRVEVSCAPDEQGNPVPRAVSVWGRLSEGDRNVLSALLTEELGIPPEGQYIVQE